MLAMVAIIYSDTFLEHDTGPTHPESPARLTAIATALRQMPGGNYLHWLAPTHRPDESLDALILQCHQPHYLQTLAKLAAQGGGSLDMDTPVSTESYRAARLAVNAWLDGVDQVVHFQQPAFVLARPPGHHALPDQGMGFCLLNNVVIAAHYALQQPEIQRVGILDWDVHHGNGTEAIVEKNPNIFYCSLHQFPCYPGTGEASYHGQHRNLCNVPLPPGSDSQVYQTAFQNQVLPFFQQVKPDLLLISAGYDANQADPLAYMNLQPSNYEVFSEFAAQISSRLVFGLEGGYHLKILAKSVVATIKPLL